MGKKELIEELIEQGVLKASNIKAAFKKIDRADFVLPKYKNLAYENYLLPIGFGQTISQPFTVAFMLELLAAQKGDKILEIGAGSGWQTALLSFLAGRRGKVIAIERIAELKLFAENSLAKYPQCQRTSTLVYADGRLGYPAAALFDKIIAAAAGQEIPRA